MGATQLGRLFFDFRQIPLHFAPSVPQGIVRAGMEAALKSSHAMLEVHDKQLLFNARGRVVKRQQIREGIGADAALVDRGSVRSFSPTIVVVSRFKKGVVLF